MQHEDFMSRCISLAKRGRGKVGNGAMVGAVLVREGNVVAEGFHGGFGLPHAEADLLSRFNAPILDGDILYVNLEPCCHIGKTPPCTLAIISRGIRKVVYGMTDPDPRVSGKGVEQLAKAGVEVTGPVLRAECERLNRGYLSLRTKRRPWITIKMASTRAGLISKSDKSPLKITSPEQDMWSHAFLRCQTDAIIVGVETVVRDNPTLDTRFDQASALKEAKYQPYRIILDPKLRIPLDAKVVSDDNIYKTIILFKDNLDRALMENKIRELTNRGVSIKPVRPEGKIFDFDSLWEVLSMPSGEFHGVGSVLVEGGRFTWDSFLNAGMIDEEIRLIGDH